MKIDLNKIPSVDLRARRHIAEKLLGPISWESEVAGYFQCPGQPLHTTPTSQRDCRITIDGAPTIFCFHQNCASTIDRLNKNLRNKIGTTKAGLKGSANKINKGVNKQRINDCLPNGRGYLNWSV